MESRHHPNGKPIDRLLKFKGFYTIFSINKDGERAKEREREKGFQNFIFITYIITTYDMFGMFCLKIQTFKNRS
uniref:Uncharacterized protein n=1 Tax=Onchocerca volvulus TaxID=6282 RepID=A0A8R1Y0J4_ONCVO